MNTEEFTEFADSLFGLLERFEIAFERDCTLTAHENSGCFTVYSLCGDLSYISRLPYHEVLHAAYEPDRYVLSYFPLCREYSKLSVPKFSTIPDNKRLECEAVLKASEDFSNALSSESGIAPHEIHALYCASGFLTVSSDSPEKLTDTVFKIEEYIRMISEKHRRIERIINAVENTDPDALSEICSFYEKIGSYRTKTGKIKNT